MLLSCVCFIFVWQLGLCFDFALLCFVLLAFALSYAFFVFFVLIFSEEFPHRAFSAHITQSFFVIFLLGVGMLVLVLFSFSRDLLLCSPLAAVFFIICALIHIFVFDIVCCRVLFDIFCLCVYVFACERACVALHAFPGPGAVSP